VAGHDFDKAAIVCTWPLVEVLYAFRAIQKRNALATYQHDMTFWALVAPNSKTKIRQPIRPHILDDD